MIEDILTGRTPFDRESIKQHEQLAIHLPWIEKLVKENGTSMNLNDVTPLFQDEIGKICRKTLECSGVYKDTESGNKALLAFLEYAGLTTI
jgi:UDPglucose--hexose-1-phosphate uridylyltransferase